MHPVLAGLLIFAVIMAVAYYLTDSDDEYHSKWTRYRDDYDDDESES